MKKIFSMLLALTLFCSPVFASDLYPALGARTGGGTGALDKIDGAGLSDGDAAVVILSDGSYKYTLDATSGASEYDPYVITPDTNAGTKRWILVIPNGPFSHVRANLQTNQSLSDATSSIVIFTTEVDDLLGEYNATTGVFSPNEDGWYSINSAIVLDEAGWALNQYLGLALYKDSTEILWGPKWYSQVSATNFAMAGLSTTIYCLSTEELTVRAYQNSGAAENIVGLAAHTWLTIDRIP